MSVHRCARRSWSFGSTHTIERKRCCSHSCELYARRKPNLPPASPYRFHQGSRVEYGVVARITRRKTSPPSHSASSATTSTRPRGLSRSAASEICSSSATLSVLIEKLDDGTYSASVAAKSVRWSHRQSTRPSPAAPTVQPCVDHADAATSQYEHASSAEQLAGAPTAHTGSVVASSTGSSSSICEAASRTCSGVPSASSSEKETVGLSSRKRCSSLILNAPSLGASKASPWTLRSIR